MTITRKEWDDMQPGDILKLQGYAAGHATFLVNTVESYPKTIDTITVITLRNLYNESLTFGHYQVQNSSSYVIKKDKPNDG